MCDNVFFNGTVGWCAVEWCVVTQNELTNDAMFFHTIEKKFNFIFLFPKRSKVFLHQHNVIHQKCFGGIKLLEF